MELNDSNREKGPLYVLKNILRRYDAYTGRLNIPGEWGERAFRGWLIIDFLLDTFKWPSKYIILGERFDVLLLDQQLQPVVNIETKKPYNVTSRKEKQDFHGRLPLYPTLRWAFLTNGQSWIRFKLAAPNGNQEIEEEIDFEIQKATEEITREFFQVIEPKKYIV